MQLTALTALVFVASIFAATAAIRKDRNLLLAAGVTLLLTASFTLTTGIDYRNGETYSYTEVNNATVKTSMTPTYTSLETDTGYSNASTWFSLLLIGTSLYMIVRGATPVTRRIQSFSRR